MTATAKLTAAQAGRPRRLRGRHVPAEGEGGLFSEGWYPVCLSGEVGVGKVVGRPFLDGRVIVYRGGDGVVRVNSAYCMHVGADLSVGKVIDNGIQCPFHGWGYDGAGRCVQTGAPSPGPLKSA